MKKRIYKLYKDILKIYFIDVDYIFSIHFLSFKYNIPKEFLTLILKNLYSKGYISYVNRNKGFKLNYSGYKHIEKEVQEERNTILVIISILTSIGVGLFSFLRS